MIKKVMLIWCLFSAAVIAEPGYFRSPALHGNTLVFTAEGDLWLADINHGQAKRLTTHPAEELGAMFSPDGRLIAFEANYEGTTEVYVMPVTGGVPKRVSFENFRAGVAGWTADGQLIISSNSRQGPPNNWSLVMVDPKDLQTTTIPLTDAIEAAVDESGRDLFFIRFGLQVSTDSVRAYRGGAKGRLWRYRLGSDQEAVELAKDHPGSLRSPMLYQQRLYFISDASGTDNLWSMSLQGDDLTQLTDYSDWEVRSASQSNGQIVYQHGADIKRLDLAAGRSQLVSLRLTSDYPHLRDHWENKPLKYLTDAKLAPDADQVVMTARGRVAVAGIDGSRLVEVSTPADSRTRHAIMSHDGRWIYALNDASGEIEVWRFAADGSVQAEQLTDDGEIYRWSLSLSPDGKWLAHDDKQGNLYLLNLPSGKNQTIITNNVGLGPYADLVWSHDSRLLAVTRNHEDDLRSRILLYEVKNGRAEILTSDKYNSYSPAFSRDGQWLYFLSDRQFNATPGAPWGDRNTGSNFDRRTEIYAYALRDGASFPFQPPTELDTADDQNADDEEQQAPVDWSGLADRLWQVPVESGNYTNLQLNDDLLFVQDQITEPNSKPKIKSITIASKPKVVDFTRNVADYQLSLDGKKLYVRQAGADNSKQFIVKAAATFPKDTTDQQLITKDWQLLIKPQQEWRQLFHDTWLMHRDSLFDPNMRGLDWPAVEQKYSQLLARVTDRRELNDVFGQMIGELNTLHSQIRGGHVATDSEAAKASSLGAVLSSARGGVLIEQIYQHDPELPGRASPLAQPGVDAKNGDLITHVNGLPASDMAALHGLLRNQLGKQTLLQLKRGKKTHKTVVKPVSIRDDYRLRYRHWVNSKRQAVTQANNDIGYLHLHAMGAADFGEFTRDFYANYQKPGLIIDVRRNRGGNIDSLIIEKLLRRNWMFWQPTQGASFTNMQQTFGGHLVVLADEFTYSDGETFVAGIKSLDLGTVIGKRTAGAGVWLSDQNRVADNGISRVAEFPQFNLDGQWLVEGTGVSPDIEVDNLPHATYQGQDAQLKAAIDLLAKKIKQQPVKPFKAEKLPPANVPAADVD